MKNYFLLLIFFLPLLTFAQNPLRFVEAYCQAGIPEAISYCLQGLYNLGVALAVVLAFFMFFFGAFKNLLSVVPDVKTEGKTMMRNSIIGLVVIFLSGAVLYWINPFIFDPRITIYRVTNIEFITVFLPQDLEKLKGQTYNFDESEFAELFPGLKKAIQGAEIDLNSLPTPTSIKNAVEIAFIYANSDDGRRSYMSKYGTSVKSLTACNYFVYRVLKEAGAIPTTSCPRAAEFHELLLSPEVQNYASSQGFKWEKLNFNIKDIRPGDILIKTQRSRSGYGHVAIVVPILNKEDKPALAIAHASISTRRNRDNTYSGSPPRLTNIPNNFQIIIRPTPF